MEHSHEPIITPEEFDKVQTELARRKRISRQYSGKSIFSSRIICGDCRSYEKAKAQLEQLCATKAAREAQAEAIGAFMFEVQELDALTEFDEKLWLTVIDTVTIRADGRVTFKFQGGTEIDV